jgi:hypothetical protein
MYLEYISINYRIRTKNKTLLFLLGSLCLLTVLGLVIICCDGDLTDDYDPPVFALQSPIVIYPSHDEITALKLISESISLTLINKNPFLTRAPPRSPQKV